MMSMDQKIPIRLKSERDRKRTSDPSASVSYSMDHIDPLSVPAMDCCPTWCRSVSTKKEARGDSTIEIVWANCDAKEEYTAAGLP
jgi:hypothetical protein